MTKPKKKTALRQRRPKLMRVLTNSERGSFACERRWFFGYLEGLTTSLTPTPLKMGTLIHLCLAAWYRSGMALALSQIINSVVDPWREQRELWVSGAFEDEQYQDQRRDEVRADDAELSTMTIEMMRGYMDKWEAGDAKHLKIIHVEPQIARWIRHPVTGRILEDRPVIGGERRRRKWAYGGAVDLVVQDRRDGLFWKMEHKSSAERDLQKWCRKLHFDPQTRGYNWALQDPIPEVSDVKEPIELAGVIYNVLRKKIPAVPSILKDGKAISRAKNIDTTRAIFLATIEKNGFDPGDYAEILDRLANNQFFYRESYPFTAREIVDFGVDMAHHALQVLDASKPGRHHPRQVAICTGGFNRQPCKFESLCMEDGNFARANFQQKGIRHEELTGEMAEPYAAQERGLILSQGLPVDPAKSKGSEVRTDRGTDQVEADDPFAILD